MVIFPNNVHHRDRSRICLGVKHLMLETAWVARI